MKSYEGVFIFPPEASAEARKMQFKNLEDLIAKYQGQMVQKMEWGKRALGYSLKKFQEGFLLIVDFQMDPAKTTEFRKNLQLQEDLLKFMITLKNNKPERKTAAKAAPAGVRSAARPSSAHVSSSPASP